MEETSKKFIKKGNKIVLKENVPDREFDSKDILRNIAELKKMLEQFNGEITKKETEIINLKSEIERLTPLLKDITKFESWAVEIQESKLKNMINDLMNESIAQINLSYKTDPVLTDSQNNSQKMVQLQNIIGRNKKVAEEIHSSVISKLIYTDCVFKNPWA